MGHNSAVVGRTEIWLRPSCSSRDSASDKISVIDILKNGGPCGGNRTRFSRKTRRAVYRFITSEFLNI